VPPSDGSLRGDGLAGLTPAPCRWWAASFANVPSPALSADLSAAKRKFADSLNEFKFRCIGDAETDDEICIGECRRWCRGQPRSRAPDPRAEQGVGQKPHEGAEGPGILPGCFLALWKWRVSPGSVSAKPSQGDHLLLLGLN